jgi:hypothetical protein
MYKKMRFRPSATISAPQEKKYVLEGVFWVPISNCNSRRSISRLVPEPRPEKLDNSEPSSSGDLISTDPRRIRNHDSFNSYFTRQEQVPLDSIEHFRAPLSSKTTYSAT